ncbi:MAG: AGE family epimerase/isomerase, partial [Pseudomonadota bacterium]|nr:AGE family epimerase/isomerase [Pseudomonadota bacterium]
MANTLDIPDYLAAMRALWRGAGWDDRLSCHYERLTADLTPHLVGQRRTLVQARQLYCHSAAYAIGGSGADRHVADALFLALEERFRGADGPWVFALDDEGAVADPRVDFYLHAFLIFAFAHYHGATGAGRA